MLICLLSCTCSYETGTGEHTIDIDLGSLPRNIARLVFTVSAWTSKLNEIDQASVRLLDAGNSVEMCRYTYEDKTDTQLYTAVVMCMLHRDKEVGTSPWKLTTIGSMCQGRADNYYQIFEGIKEACGPIVA
jgi:stress response protein SCP2